MELARRVAAALAIDAIEAVAEGHQSRVFRVTGRHGPAVVKVLDAAVVDRAGLEARLDVVAALAALDAPVCRPLLLGEHRITELTSGAGLEYYVVCFELAAGVAPDPGRPSDARSMGAALGRLHAAMGRLPTAPLPVVDALRAAPAADPTAGGPHQLIHGDFNAGNLRVLDDAIRIFDFDDCGYGPPAFDVANALYMVLFDASTTGTMEIYETFRPCFLDGYAAAAGAAPPTETLDRFIDRRVGALGRWLADLAHAPVGIRTASPAWQATLRSFVAAHRPTTSS